MSTNPQTNQSVVAPKAQTQRVRKDVIWVLVLVVAYWLLAARFEFAERMLRWTGQFENWQIDELPLTLLVFALAMAWFSFRRWREQAAALKAQLMAEQALQSSLQHNRKLAQQLITVQEAERKHVARELHDEIGQCCVAMRVDAATIARETEGALPLAHASALSIAEASSHLQAVVRQMLERIRPAGLDDLGLEASLQRLTRAWSSKHQVQCDIAVVGDISSNDEATNMTVYRAVQEALTNIAKHAQAKQVQVRLEQEAKQLTLMIEDDGIGRADGTVSTQGFGLLGMRERVDALHGSFSLSRSSLGGLCIQISLPMTAALLPEETHP